MDSLEKIFHAARELAEGVERDAFLDEACGTGTERRDMLDALLRASAGASEALPGGRSRPEESVLRSLEARTGSPMRVTLDTPGPEGPPVRVTEETRLLRELPGRYQMLGEIGRGGIGVVFKGRDQDLGRDVAFKVLRSEYAAHEELLARFVEEAQIGGQLQHPGIVPVYELGMQTTGAGDDPGEGDRPYFVMKLVRGETLAALLGRRKDVAEDRRGLLGIFEQVCQTMAYAHSRHVVHRDLKPANVMIGSFGEVQVVDWGFAKVLARGGVHDEVAAGKDAGAREIGPIETVRSGSGSSSRPGSTMGTPAYMAPEQARGEIGSVDERTDVFGLGAILCEILTGAPPYVRENGDLVAQAASGALDSARERLASCGADEELVALCGDCLKAARVARPGSAGVLAERMSAYLTSVEERARKARVEAAEARVRAEALRRTQRLGVGLLASISVGLVASLWFWRAAEVQRGRAVEAADAEALAAASAEEQRQLAASRAAELEQVTSFQAQQLTAIVPERMGARLRESVLAAAPEKDRDALRTQLLGINFTTLAATSLESSIFRPTLTAIDAQFQDQPLVRALLLESSALALWNLDRLDAALEAQEVAYELNREARGPEAEETLRTLSTWGSLLVRKGDVEAAAPRIEEALETSQRVFGMNSRPATHATHSMAGLLLLTNRIDEARDLLEDLLDALRAGRLESTDFEPEILGMIATLLLEAGELDEAERYYRESLALSEAAGGGNEGSVLIVKNNLGQLLMQRGDEGEQEEAQALVEEVLERRKDMFGEDHVLSLLASSQEGLFLMQRGEYAEAEAVFRKSVDGFRAIVGDDNQHTLTALGNLGSALYRMGELDEAEPYVRQAADGFRRRLGDRYERTLIYRFRLSAVLRDLGRHAEAEEVARECAPFAEETWGRDFWRTVEGRSLRGEAMVGLEAFAEAEPILLEAYETLASVTPWVRRRPVLSRTARSLVDLYEAVGNAEQVAQWQAVLDEL